MILILFRPFVCYTSIKTSLKWLRTNKYLTLNGTKFHYWLLKPIFPFHQDKLQIVHVLSIQPNNVFCRVIFCWKMHCLLIHVSDSNQQINLLIRIFHNILICIRTSFFGRNRYGRTNSSKTTCLLRRLQIVLENVYSNSVIDLFVFAEKVHPSKRIRI